MPPSTHPLFPSIDPACVRYIKLGREGGWEKECIASGIVRLGFGTANPTRLALCQNGEWQGLTQDFITEGKDKGTATRFTNEVRLFFDDPGTTLWLTFVGEHLSWGFLTSDPAAPHPDGKGVLRHLVGGWTQIDRVGEALTKDRLSGALTKLAAFRGTSCTVGVADYAVRRINAEQTPEVERAVAAMKEMTAVTLDLIRLLGPKDFETLIDLIFATSGWRRLGVVGKTQKTLDLDLILPTTGERAFVQVKSETNPAELAEYVTKFEELGLFDRMFFVFHTGQADTDDDRVTVVGPERLSEMVVESGLVGWLLRKVS